MTQVKVRPPLLARRAATRDDAAEIADFANAAGDGLPMTLWKGLAGENGNALAFGRQRAQREVGAYSYTRTELALVDGVTAGGIIDYGLGHEPGPITAEMPPLIVPLNKLENLVCGSWYVNILAVKPFWRRLGLGRTLLEAADLRARADGRDRVSVIVADANDAARALYNAHGFREIARRKMVKAGWNGQVWNGRGENWLLLVKELR